MKKQREAHWVEVKYKNDKRWKKRIAVDLKCNPVICVASGDEEDYLNWLGYLTAPWNQWREIKEPEWVHYETMEECFEDLKDVWIRYKKTITTVLKVTQFDFKNNTSEIDDWTYTLEHMFKTFEKLDGTPCGKLKGCK